MVDRPAANEPAGHYDRVTAAWELMLGDHLHHGLFDAEHTELVAATENLTRAMADAASPRPGARVIDLGCGTGAQACWLAARYDVATVVGVSTSAVGVDLARERAQSAGLTASVTFKCADALDTELETGAFDIVWLLESAQYLVPRERLMRECARLLAPGGRLVLCDVMLVQSLELRDLRRLHGKLQILRDTFGEATMSTPLQYEQAARAAGLCISDELDLTEEVRPTYEWWRTRARKARSGVTALIGDQGWATFIAGCDAMEEFFADGIVCYALIVGEKPV